MRHRLALALVGVVAALLVAGCDAGAAAPSAVEPTVAPASATVVVPASPTPNPTPAPTPLPSGAAVAMDTSLLDILPATVAGAPVTSEAHSFAEAVTDHAFIANVDRAAFFVVVDGSDLASGAVAHLRAGVFSDALWGDWRFTYDDGACAQSGGVLARANSTIAGRQIYVTTCAGGLRVYQVWLPGPGVAVSLMSFGERKFGEQLMAGLKG